MTERWRARPQAARAPMSNSVSGGECRVIQLTFLRRFYLPRVSYMCTKEASNPIHLISL